MRDRRVLAYIEKGRAEGAYLVVGGGTPEQLAMGYYIEPTADRPLRKFPS